MPSTGIGYLLSELSGDDEASRFVARAIGQVIADVTLHRDGGRDGDGSILFHFHSGQRLRMYDTARSCCESRYMTCDDDLTRFRGATLLEVYIHDLTQTEGSDDTNEEKRLVFVTTVGAINVVTYNHHNGYYGGISITADGEQETG